MYIQHSKIEMEDWANLMRRVGPDLSELGFSLRDVEIAMLVLSDRGVEGRTAIREINDAIKEATLTTEDYSYAISKLNAENEKLLEQEEDLDLQLRSLNLERRQAVLDLKELQTSQQNLTNEQYNSAEYQEQYTIRIERAKLRIEEI